MLKKDFLSNALLSVKKDANVFLDMSVITLLTVTAMENVLLSTNVFLIQLLQRQPRPPLQHHHMDSIVDVMLTWLLIPISTMEVVLLCALVMVTRALKVQHGN